MKIAVIGAGYVGLVTAACFADLGNEVINVDNDKSKIDLLKKGKCHFYEPGLEELVKRNAEEGRLSFTTQIKSAAQKSDIIFIAVGTPPLPSGGADLSQIENVAKQVAGTLGKKYKLVIEKSTVPVRTGLWVRNVIRSNAPKGAKFDVASNPEFLREGTAIYDFMHPERIVLGANTQRAKKLLGDLYKALPTKLVLTDLQSAELIKHASNSFLAMKISFMNAVARICEKAGANVEEVAQGMGLDSRIGPRFLNAGIGFGGFCFPKDVSAFIHISDCLGYDFKLLRAVEEVNMTQVRFFLDKMERALGTFTGKTAAVWGLAFKPNTDDMRFAPSIEVITRLHEEGVKIRAYDPKAMGKSKGLIPEVELCKSAIEAVEKADFLVVLTEWNEFKEIDLKAVKKKLKHPRIFDGRNIYDPKQMKKMGIMYESIGR